MHVDGSCHCGHITYTAEIDPGKVIICHCIDCQVLSSSAFRMVVLAEKGTFRLLGGEPTIYVKTADSGTAISYITACHCAAGVRKRSSIIPAACQYFSCGLSWLRPIGNRHDVSPAAIP